MNVDCHGGTDDDRDGSVDPDAHPGFLEFINRYQKWNRIYTYAGIPCRNEPIWEDGRLHLRVGYPFPEWSSYIVQANGQAYDVLTATTERHNEPIESWDGTFSRIDEAGKYVIWNLGSYLRTSLRLPSLTRRWDDEGLDPRVNQISLEKFVSKYELKVDPSYYFILRAGGIQPENHLLPLTYDELDAELLDGISLDTIS